MPDMMELLITLRYTSVCSTYLYIQQLFPLWLQQIQYTLVCTLERTGTDEQHQQYKVWEDCQEVRCLSGAADAFNQNARNANPAEQQTQCQLPIWHTNPFVHRPVVVQNGAIEVELGRRTYRGVLYASFEFRINASYPFRFTSTPGKRTAERGHKVAYRNRKYRGIITQYEQQCQCLADAHTTHQWRYIEHLDAASTRELTHHHLEIVERTSHQEQHYQIRYQKGTATVLHCGVREAPNVAETDRQCNTRQQELDTTVPFLAHHSIRLGRIIYTATLDIDRKRVYFLWQPLDTVSAACLSANGKKTARSLVYQQQR
uniref:Uncharacterized protein n=1 Tax=Anopheles culicifacies TaxID=139723 RepID=A0A182LUS0_9DIPT